MDIEASRSNGRVEVLWLDPMYSMDTSFTNVIVSGRVIEFAEDAVVLWRNCINVCVIKGDKGIEESNRGRKLLRNAFEVRDTKNVPVMQQRRNVWIVH